MQCQRKHFALAVYSGGCSKSISECVDFQHKKISLCAKEIKGKETNRDGFPFMVNKARLIVCCSKLLRAEALYDAAN